MKRVWIKSIVLGVLCISFIGLFSNNQFDFAQGQPSIDYEEIHQSILQEINPGYHEEWYKEQIDMIFIVPDGYEDAVKNLSEWKTQKGVPTKIINKSTYLQYSGRNEAEKLRNCIKDYYEKYDIEWVLLVGDTDLIPTRFVYNPDTRVLREAGSNYYEERGNDEFKPTDFYYADLTGSWDEDGDGIYGEGLLENSEEEIDWIPEVHVGRFPGNSISEIEAMVNKTLYYETVQNPGEWMNSMLLGAAIQDWPTSADSDGEQEVWLANKIIEESVMGNINHTLLAETTQWSPNLTMSTYKDEFDLGQSMVFFAGHGSSTSFNGINGGSSTTILTTSAANNLENYEMPALVYADACSTNMYDNHSSDASMGEVMIKHERGGAIGYIGGMRLSYYYVNDTYSTCSLCELNRGMARIFFQEFFLQGSTQQGKALNDMKTTYVNSAWLQNNPEWGSAYNIHEIEWERKNVLTYNLLGDPEVDIFTQNPNEFESPFGKIALYYEGNVVQVTIEDKAENPIPNARISIVGEDGAYNTYEANENGVLTIYFPNKIQNYNYTLTAHNMIPSTGSIAIINDDEAPVFTEAHYYTPEKPTVNDEIQFTIPAADNNTPYGSIACGIVVLSSNDFESYALHEFPYINGTQQIVGTLPKLKPSTYSYIIFAYDYAQNYVYVPWVESMTFKIPISIIFILMLVVNVGLVSFVGYFIFKKYRENLTR